MGTPGEAEALRGGLLHFDCAAGVAGDMVVGALVDLGVPTTAIEEALRALDLGGYRVSFARLRRGALVGTKFHVHLDAPAAVAGPAPRPAPGPGAAAGPHDRPGGEGGPHAPADAHGHEGQPPHAHQAHGHHPHRHYRDIRALLKRAPLEAGVRARALAIFERIAAVEGRLHGVAVDEVAFHEVGAVDSIVDIVATAAALEWLRPARITSRAVALGHGQVHTAHGLLPVPAPATLELLAGALVEDGGSAFELTTPTGAAILAASVERFGPLPPMQVLGVGWGAGDRELPDRPNLLRVIVGQPPPERAPGSGEECLVVEANVDDMTPELVAPLIANLMAAGARDAWVSPLLMKKGRPGWLVGALCDPARLADVERALFRGSSTIGVRRHAVERTVLARRLVEVETPFGVVRVKVSGSGDGENAAPELEDCARLAHDRGVPLRRVHAEAIAAFYRRR